MLLDSPIIGHLIQKLEGKKEKVSFSRVDGDTLENLIKKDEATVSKLSDKEKETLKPLIEDVVKEGGYTVQLESLDSKSMPFVLTQPEFMRRMKEMQQTGGGGMMGNMPEMFNLVVNTNHELVGQILRRHFQTAPLGNHATGRNAQREIHGSSCPMRSPSGQIKVALG